jgi:hypothetical protein
MKARTLIITLAAVSAPLTSIASYAAASCGVGLTPASEPIGCTSDNGYAGSSFVGDTNLTLTLSAGNGAPVSATSLGYDAFGEFIPGCATNRRQLGQETLICQETIFFHDLTVIDD